jgi:cytochrome c biogenesis protein CcmG/thiol:disulfide interchange protein DsbE
VIGLAFAVAAVAGGCGSPRRGEQRAAESVVQGSPEPAPPFSFTTFGGQKISLDQLKGRPVVLNFWSTTCPHCADLMPRLEEVYERHRAQGLEVLGIATPDSLEAAKKKSESLGVTYPSGMDAAAVQAYGIRAVPATFFISKEGNLISARLGAMSVDELEEHVQKIL